VGATASALFHTGTFPFLIGDTRASADFIAGYLPRETPELSAYRFFSGKFTRREGLTEISGVWAYTPTIAAGDGFRNTRPNSVAAVGVEIIGRPLASLTHGTGEDDTYDWGQSA